MKLAVKNLLFFSGTIDSEGSQVESLSLNLCQVDFRLCQDHQLPFSCEYKVGRGGVQEYFAEKCPFCVPNLASGKTHGASVVNNLCGVQKKDEHGPHLRYQTKRSLAYQPGCHPVCRCRNMQTLADSQRPG